MKIIKSLKMFGNIVYNDDLNYGISDFSDVENIYSEKLQDAKIIRLNMRNKLYVELNYYPQILYIIDNNSYYKIDNQFYNIIENIIKS